MIDASVIILWSLVLILGTLVARKSVTTLRNACHTAFLQLVAILPRIILALLLAGFIAKLLPTQLIGHMMGHDSGWTGILVACLVGGIMPAGPMIAFPLVIVLRNADAGLPQIIAFLTAWSVFAWHRVLVYEVAIMGWPFTLVRMGSSLLLPIIAAGLTFIACAVTGMR